MPNRPKRPHRKPQDQRAGVGQGVRPHPRGRIRYYDGRAPEEPTGETVLDGDRVTGSRAEFDLAHYVPGPDGERLTPADGLAWLHGLALYAVNSYSYAIVDDDFT